MTYTFTRVLDERVQQELRQAAAELVAQVRRVGELLEQLAQEHGFTAERLQLRVCLDGMAVAYGLTVDGEERDLPRSLHKLPEAEIRIRLLSALQTPTAAPPAFPRDFEFIRSRALSKPRPNTDGDGS